jgi:hypothetical protein
MSPPLLLLELPELLELLPLLLPLPLELELPALSVEASGVFDGFDELPQADATATAIPPTAARTTNLTDLMDNPPSKRPGRAHYRRLPTWRRLTFVALFDLG